MDLCKHKESIFLASTKGKKKSSIEHIHSLCSVNKDGEVLRALASHPVTCGSGLNPGVDAVRGLSLLLVLTLAP